MLRVRSGGEVVQYMLLLVFIIVTHGAVPGEAVSEVELEPNCVRA